MGKERSKEGFIKAAGSSSLWMPLPKAKIYLWGI